MNNASADNLALDTFQALSKAAASACEASFSTISLVDADRQWFNIGSNSDQTPQLSVDFCAHIMQSDALVEINNIAENPLFVDAIVHQSDKIRFFAATPIKLKDHRQVGMLCVFSRQQHHLSQSQRETLNQLALVVGFTLDALKADITNLHILPVNKAGDAAAPLLPSDKPRNATSRKAAQLLPIEQKQQIQQIIENQSVATFMIDADHQVTHWNSACEILTGLASENIIGKAEAWRGFYNQARPCLADLVLDGRKEDAAIFYNIQGPSLLVPEGWHAEGWFEQLGGQRRYAIFDAAPIMDAKGNITAVIETLQDITASKLAEQQLLEEQQYLESVIEGTLAGTWRWNVATGECKFNHYWAEMIGYQLAELEEGEAGVETWARLTHADDLMLCRNLLDQHLSGKTNMYEAEFRMRHRDGHWVWILARGRVLTWTADGQPAWMYGIHTDITLRKQQEYALKKSQDFLDRTSRMAHIGGWELDLEANQLYWSQETCRIHDVPANHQPSIEESLNCYPDEAKLILEAAYKLSMNNGMDYDLELPHTNVHGQQQWVRTTGSTEFIDGQARRIYGTFQDITSDKKMEMELRQAYSNLEEFTAIASHDLKSPLLGIADLTEWIMDDLGPNIDNKVKNNLERIQLRIKRLHTLIDDLLHYSRAGKMSAERKLIDPQAMIHEVLEIQHLPADFKINVKGELKPFLGAETPLKTILRNLISNAIKHHDKAAGLIEIKLLTVRGYNVFEISDDGPGIPEYAQKRVFKLFQTVSKSNTSASGLGLAVSKRMVEAHNGRIELESSAAKRGTTFRVWWPEIESANP